MLRIIAVSVDAGTAAHVGGPVRISHKTFLVDAPEVEAWLKKGHDFNERSVIGVEVEADCETEVKA